MSYLFPPLGPSAAADPPSRPAPKPEKEGGEQEAPGGARDGCAYNSSTEKNRTVIILIHVVLAIVIVQ